MGHPEGHLLKPEPGSGYGGLGWWWWTGGYELGVRGTGSAWGVQQSWGGVHLGLGRAGPCFVRSSGQGEQRGVHGTAARGKAARGSSASPPPGAQPALAKRAVARCWSSREQGRCTGCHSRAGWASNSSGWSALCSSCQGQAEPWRQDRCRCALAPSALPCARGVKHTCLVETGTWPASLSTPAGPTGPMGLGAEGAEVARVSVMWLGAGVKGREAGTEPGLQPPETGKHLSLVSGCPMLQPGHLSPLPWMPPA